MVETILKKLIFLTPVSDPGYFIKKRRNIFIFDTDNSYTSILLCSVILMVAGAVWWITPPDPGPRYSLEI